MALMYPPQIRRLIELFQKFPGIGPRQAARFAFFILGQDPQYVAELSEALRNVSETVAFCSQCYRSTDKTAESPREVRCAFCANARRNPRLIAVIEKEADMENVEKSGLFDGLYHVLGGVISPLDADSPKRLHLRALYERVRSLAESDSATPCEVVLATNSTTEGDTTALYIERIFEPLVKQFPNLKISRLGRGLSLGAELEYADEVTIRNAFENRK